ncbi:MAG: aminotransferase class III-fold pyridoxal phosphate-dependent enzyme [Myxococcales bacterium]|nr:aminotransferase class III-fold pyridoxal phosphate-dependent enzyme [Myxococcales bacterium]MCB9549761.1 aminotransferase class III-fold pyridoxal phosphate-dependent enzyme [Myxococcales bacterium]
MAEGTLEARQRRHVLSTWTPQAAASPVHIASGDGAVFYDDHGNAWLDFESQVFNANAGHGQQAIIEAIQQQASTLAVAHPAAVFEAKARLGELLTDVTPGDIDAFFLCLSGAEAVENAYKIARMITGRQKVVARRRSYHGASMGALSLTGDWRRWPAEPGLWGVARTEDPYCYRCPFGLEHPACGVRCASHLEHVIEMEGPENIAAVFMEGVTGANGGFIPPPEYWPRVREICDRHGILLVADEVFTGFGRTGKWFAVDHWGVVPDLITMAKGITGGYAPLGAVGLRPHLARHFDDATLWCGLTSYAHPVSCAAAVAAIGVYQDQGLIAHAAAMGDVLGEGFATLKARHPIIGDARHLGLLGTLELVADRDTRAPLVGYAQNPAPGSPLARLKAGLKKRHVHALVRGNTLMVTPPLCITETQLQDGLARIDAALAEAAE